MKTYIFFNSDTQRHFTSAIRVDNRSNNFVFSCDNLYELTDIPELIYVLDYLRERPSYLVSPSPETIERLTDMFPTLFSTIISKPFDETTNFITYKNAFDYPYCHKFTIYHNTTDELIWFSNAPHFGDREHLTVLSVIYGLEHKTKAETLMASLNLVKLGHILGYAMTHEEHLNQISLFPELFAI